MVSWTRQASLSCVWIVDLSQMFAEHGGGAVFGRREDVPRLQGLFWHQTRRHDATTEERHDRRACEDGRRGRTLHPASSRGAGAAVAAFNSARQWPVAAEGTFTDAVQAILFVEEGISVAVCAFGKLYAAVCIDDESQQPLRRRQQPRALAAVVRPRRALHDAGRREPHDARFIEIYVLAPGGYNDPSSKPWQPAQRGRQHDRPLRRGNAAVGERAATAVRGVVSNDAGTDSPRHLQVQHATPGRPGRAVVGRESRLEHEDPVADLHPPRRHRQGTRAVLAPSPPRVCLCYR